MLGWKRMDGQRMRGRKQPIMWWLSSFQVLDLRLEPNLRSIIPPACNYERCSISARKSIIQDVGKVSFIVCVFFCLWKSEESTLFRNVQHDSHVWMLQRVSVLIRAPAGSRAEVCKGLQPPAAAGLWRLWERAAGPGQLDAAPGHNG